MSTVRPAPPTSGHRKRPLLGLRKKPGRVALVFMRMPVRAYAHDQGHLLGRAFLQFTHVGRNSGKLYQAVAMVLDYDTTIGEAVICAAWGPDVDWYRNLQAHPATNVKLDRTSFTPAQRFLTDDEAFQVLVRFRAAHPHRSHLISRILGWGDLDEDERVHEFLRIHPFIAFRPANRQPSPSERLDA